MELHRWDHTPWLSTSTITHHSLLPPCHPRQQKDHSKPPQSLLGQLLWREFFYTVGAATPNFHRMEGNPLCKKIPWGNSAELVGAWKEGRTGYPWIDACMVQLRQWVRGWACWQLECMVLLARVCMLLGMPGCLCQCLCGADSAVSWWLAAR
jgi:hypothetical protein